jgi:ABC-type Co2+ transport system permease subunit
MCILIVIAVIPRTTDVAAIVAIITIFACTIPITTEAVITAIVLTIVNRKVPEIILHFEFESS